MTELTEFEHQVYLALGDTVDWEVARRVAAAIEAAAALAQQATMRLDPFSVGYQETALAALRGDPA